MTTNRNPYKVGDRHYVDKDPNNEWYYVFDISAELALSNTTAVSATSTVDRMTVMEGPTLQAGKYFVVKLSGPSDKTVQTQDDASVKLAVTCANGEKFDKTLWFNQDDKQVAD